MQEIKNTVVPTAEEISNFLSSSILKYVYLQLQPYVVEILKINRLKALEAVNKPPYKAHCKGNSFFDNQASLIEKKIPLRFNLTFLNTD